MAKKVETIVTLIDDLDGGNADRTITFGVDGITYEIDLSAKNATAFEKALAPYLEAARRTPKTTRPKSGPTRTRTPSAGADLAEIRAWATANGHNLSSRGRIPQAVQDAYAAAH